MNIAVTNATCVSLPLRIASEPHEHEVFDWKQKKLLSMGKWPSELKQILLAAFPKEYSKVWHCTVEGFVKMTAHLGSEFHDARNISTSYG